MSDRDKKFKPKYPAVEESLEIFKKRVTEILQDTGFEKNQNRVQYLNRMLELRDRMQSLLQSYPQYKPEKKPHDPTTASIPKNLEEHLKKLATPPKRFVKAALSQINKTVQEIKQDHQFCKNKCKARRVSELNRHRKKLCCRFSKYPKSPNPSEYCMRFKPCSIKVVPLYAVSVESKTEKRLIDIRSRILEIDFDDETNELALPNYNKIKACLDFYNQIIDRLNHQHSTYKQSKEEKKKLSEILEALNRRRCFVEGLKAEIECRKKIKPNSMKVENKPTDVPGRFASKWENFRPFTHYLNLPSRKKLQEALRFYEQLSQEQRNAKRKQEEVSFNTDSTKIEQDGKSKEKRIKPYVQRIENNICFINSVIDSLPEKPAHCSVVEEEHFRFKSTEKKQIGINGDDKTDELARPKLTILEETGRANNYLLNEFLSDTRNRQALSKPDTIDDEETDKKQKKSSISVIYLSPMQKKKLKEEIKIHRAHRVHKKLFKRKERLQALIQEQLNRLEACQSTRTAAPSYFHHYRACNAKEEKESYSSYRMKKPHNSICHSKAKRIRLITSLEKYHDWIKVKQADVHYKKDIDETLRRVQNGLESQEDDRDKDLDKKTKKMLNHSTRLIRNMQLLQSALKGMSLPEEDFHTKSHRKFESAEKDNSTKGSIDMNHLLRLSEPKNQRLRSTFENYRELMSKAKQHRLELQLGLTADELDCIKGKCSKPPRPSSKQEDSGNLLQQIEKKVIADVFDEIVCRLLNKLSKVIAKRMEPGIMTSNRKALLDKALSLLFATNGQPKDEMTLEHYYRLAQVTGDFVFNTMADSVIPSKKKKHFTAKPMNSVESNQDLLKIADSLLKKEK